MSTCVVCQYLTVVNCDRGEPDSGQSASVCKSHITVYGTDPTRSFLARRLRLHADITWRLAHVEQLEFLHAGDLGESRSLRTVEREE